MTSIIERTDKAATTLASISLALIVLSAYVPVNNISDQLASIPMDYGVSVHNLTAKDLQMIEGTNFTWIRADYYQLSEFAGFLPNYNLNVLGIIDGGINIKGGRLDYNYWNATVSSIIHNYGSSVQAWEILNEPLSQYPHTSGINLSASDYFALLRYAYNIIKYSDPGSVILGFGGIQVIDNVVLNISWVEDLVSSGALSYCDAVSVHLYSGTSDSSLTASNYNVALNRIEGIIGDKQIWITETGQPVGMGQVQYIKAVYPLLSSFGIYNVFWYEFRDWIPEDGKYFGLLQNDYSPRDSYIAFRIMINGQ